MRWLLFAVACGLGLSPAALSAQEARPDHARVLAPYVDEFTLAVGVLDLKRLEPADFYGRLAWLAVPKRDIEQSQRQAEQIHRAALQAGVQYVYILFDMEEGFQHGPLIVIPMAEQGKPDEVARLLKKDPSFKIVTRDNVVLAGQEKIVARAQRGQGKGAEAFVKALAELEPLPHRVVQILPTPFKRAQEELLPRLPDELGGAPITTITQGMQWAGLGADLAKPMQVKVVVQAKDAEAAQELNRVLNKLLEAVSEDKEFPWFPNPEQVVKVLRPQVKEDRLVLTLDEKAIQAVLVPAADKAQQAARRAISMNNLRQIGLAMHNYHDTYRSFPAQGSYADGKPLLSWRVHLLPYLEQEPLYRQFKLDEPWDSPHNKKLLTKMPDVLRSPFQGKSAEEGKTVYQVPAGKELIFDGPKKTKINEIFDGTSNTILAVEVDESKAVYWTKPEDYRVDPKKPKENLVLEPLNGIMTLFADGSARVLRANLPDETMWLYFHPKDGMPIRD